MDVKSGTDNAIRQNLIYGNTVSGIELVAGANAGQQPPQLTGAYSINGTSTVQGTITGFADSTSYTLEFFASMAGDPTNSAQAHVFLGSVSITTDSSGNAPIYLTLNVAVPFGQTITATATSPSGNTSELAGAVVVASPYVVTNTSDNGDDTFPTLGSLRQVIESINLPTAVSSTISFDIPTGPFVITLENGTPLPALTRPVLVDGTSQPHYTGTPIIELDANGAPAGLTLGAVGSGIQGLSIVGADGPGILIDSGSDLIIDDYLGVNPSGTAGPGNQIGVLVNNVGQTTIGGTTAAANLIGFNTQAGVSIAGTSASNNVVASNFIGTNAANANLGNAVGVAIDASDNTIGGTISGAGNTIAFNNGYGVDVVAGTGNAIRRNLIYGNTGAGIFLTGTANNSQQPPSSLAYTSVTNLTTIDYTLTGTPGDTYTIDFFASIGSNAPAAELVGSTSVLLSTSSQSFIASFNLSTPLINGQYVTATATDADGNTSKFATTAAPFTAPYVVTTGSDSVIGSLRQAILNADAAGGTPTITFALPTSSYQITPTAPLPSITTPVIIDGTSLTGFDPSTSVLVQLIGSVFNVGGDGLTLGAGSGGSKIKGLAIGGFLSGSGIRVESNDNQILGDYVGEVPGATPASTPNALGIYVSGSDNTIGGTSAGAANTIANNNGPGVTVDTGIGDLISANPIFNNNPQGIVLQNGGNQTLGFNAAASPPPPTLILRVDDGHAALDYGAIVGIRREHDDHDRVLRQSEWRSAVPRPGQRLPRQHDRHDRRNRCDPVQRE